MSAVENHLAVYRHGDAVSHGAYLLDVPCSQGREFHAFGRDNSVDRSVLLVYAQVLVDRSVVVEHLNLHAVIGGVDAHGGADADAVVDALSESKREFESQDEITVLLLGVEVARSAVLRRHVDRSVRRGRSWWCSRSTCASTYRRRAPRSRRQPLPPRVRSAAWRAVRVMYISRTFDGAAFPAMSRICPSAYGGNLPVACVFE